MVDRRVPGRTATYVTPAEVKAAQMKVRRMIKRGERPSPALQAIANARGESSMEDTRPQPA